MNGPIALLVHNNEFMINSCPVLQPRHPKHLIDVVSCPVHVDVNFMSVIKVRITFFKAQV